MPLPLAGLAGNIASGIFGGDGGAMPGDAFKGPNVTFGSVNFKSDGAGDRGKSAGDITPAATDTLAAAASAPDAMRSRSVASSGMPPWLPVAGLAAVILAAAFFLLRRSR